MATTNDLTTGPLRTHFKTLAIPAAIGMTFSTLYNVVDIYFAGRISTEAQAGLTISFQAYFLLITFGFGLGTAMSALVGGAVGGKDHAAGRKIALQGVGYGVCGTALLMAVAGYVGPLLIALISEPGPYRDTANRYFVILIFAMPGFILAFGVNGILQSLGDAISLQRALIAAFFANVILNPLLIFGIPNVWDGMGFDGIAVSTIISQTGVALFLLWRVFTTDLACRPEPRDFIPDWANYKDITVQLVPSSFAMIVMISAGFVVQFYLKSFGGSAQAAYGVALRVEQLFLLPVFGLTGALLPIAAQNFGAGAHERVRQAFLTCIGYGLLFMCIACPALWLGAETLMRFFADDPEVIRFGVTYLHIDGIILPAYMTLFAINSFLQALKRPLYVLLVGIYRQALAVFAFVWIYVEVLGFGVMGIWIGIATAVITGLVLSLCLAQYVSKPLIGGLFPGSIAASKAA